MTTIDIEKEADGSYTVTIFRGMEGSAETFHVTPKEAILLIDALAENT